MLRLESLGPSQHQIARSCSISQAVRAGDVAQASTARLAPPIHEDLQTHKDLTLQLVWQERRESDPEGYAYSRFCDLYRQWLKRLVDYAGAAIPVHHPQTGAIQESALFVAVQGASSYTFGEATTGQDLPNWIGSHIRAFEFFGGVAEAAVPDNLKSAVTHPSYYEPDLNPTYRDLAEHYGIAIIPARTRK